MIKKNWNTKKIALEKTKPTLHWRFKLYAVLVIICTVGVIYVLRLPDYQVRGVRVENLVLSKESDIIGVANEYLGYKYLFVVPQSNVWLYPRAKILTQIKALPSVEDADVSLDNSNTLVIKLVEKKHEFVWCDASNGCYYMNRDGYVFAPSPTFVGNVFLTFRGIIESDPLGKNYLPKDKMQEVIGLVEELKKIGLTVTDISIISPREMHLVLNSGSSITVALDKSLSEPLSNIKTLLKSQDFINASGGFEKIHSLDMRYGKKAFWK